MAIPLEDVPFDASIPALRAIREHGLVSVLERAGFRARSPRTQTLKYHPGTRCTLRLDLDGEPMAMKVYADDPFPLVALLRRFEREGLASGKAPTAPPLLTFDPSLHLIMTGWLDGPSGKDLIARGAGERMAELAVTWLQAAARSPIELGDHYGPEALLTDTAKRVRILDAADPDLGSLAAGYYERLASGPPAAAPTNVRHASFKPSSMIDVSGPGLIDWDGFRQGAPELEAAGFLASLLRMAKSPGADPEPLRRTELAFREGLAGLAEMRALSWYLAAELIKLAARLARRKPRGWHDRANRLLHDASAALEQRL